MNQQMNKGVIEYVILELLGSKEYYGYEISQYINQYVKFKESSIYIILSRLEQKGYVDVRKDKSRINNKIVKYYKLNAEGEQYLINMKDKWKSIRELVIATKNRVEEEKNE